MPSITEADVVRMRESLFFSGPDVGRKLSRFWLLLLLSAVIASAGVVADSTGTVIGAMIVAPLMVPILGTVVAVVLGDHRNLVRSLGLVVAGTAAVVGVAYLIGLVVPTHIVAETNGQVASRVNPRLIDLVAALATGAVGAIALAREDISDTLPGVAIAISLVPPLAVVGLTLESGEPSQAFGAFLLFATNVTAILTAGLVVSAIYGMNRIADQERSSSAHRTRSIVLIVASLVIIAVPLTAASVRVAHETTQQDDLTRVVTRWADDAGWDVRAVQARPDDYLVQVEGATTPPEPAVLRDALDRAGLQRIKVTVDLNPVHRFSL